MKLNSIVSELQAEVTLMELNENEEVEPRTVSVDQRVGEQSKFRTVEAFLVPDQDSRPDADNDGLREIMMLDLEMIVILPVAVQGDFAWFRGRSYLDAADIKKFIGQGAHLPRKELRKLLGFDLDKLDADEVVELESGWFHWAPLALVVGMVTVQKKAAGGRRGTGVGDGSDTVRCRYKITEATLNKLVQKPLIT